MALTLTFALVVGTALALTVVPVLASFATRLKHGSHPRESITVRVLSRVYQPLLDRALKFRAWVLAAAVASLVVSGVVLHGTGSEFLPKLDEGSLWVRGFMPQTIAPGDAARIVRKTRAIVSRMQGDRQPVGPAG